MINFFILSWFYFSAAHRLKIQKLGVLAGYFYKRYLPTEE